ncbi:phosphopantetheine-binding protein [Zhenpiania hominis]|uniref:phosphopantetheine-binding protein n=1 Tax=Zhenpiania hominis TaxID=2763644 RepID=UPI0039F45386
MEKLNELLNELRPEIDFSESENFIEDGYLDSFDLVALVGELEQRYNITIDGLDIIPENFTNMDTIVELIRKSGGQI